MFMEDLIIFLSWKGSDYCAAVIADGSQDLFPKAGKDVGREGRAESPVNPGSARKQPLTEPRKPWWWPSRLYFLPAQRQRMR